MKKLRDRFDANSFLLFITILLFFVLYITGAIVFRDKNFIKPQVFLNLFIDIPCIVSLKYPRKIRLAYLLQLLKFKPIRPKIEEVLKVLPQEGGMLFPIR